METNWKGNRAQKINKETWQSTLLDSMKHASIVDYQIKLVPKTPIFPLKISHGGKVCGTGLHTAVQDNINKQTNKQTIKKRETKEEDKNKKMDNKE